MAAVGVVASIVLGAVFLASGAAKIASGDAWPAQARDLGVAPVLVPAVPWSELALGGLLVSQAAPVVAAGIALVVLVAFTGLIVLQLSRGRHPACACFGAWSAKPLGRGHVARNAGFMVLAEVAMIGGAA